MNTLYYGNSELLYNSGGIVDKICLLADAASLSSVESEIIKINIEKDQLRYSMFTVFLREHGQNSITMSGQVYTLDDYFVEAVFSPIVGEEPEFALLEANYPDTDTEVELTSRIQMPHSTTACVNFEMPATVGEVGIRLSKPDGEQKFAFVNQVIVTARNN